MREIKYRAWNKNEKKMYSVAKIDFAFLKVTCYEEGKALIGYKFDFRDIILMQYTNLKDKDDKEIFEGDIVQGFQDQQGIIDFSKGTFWLRFTNKRMKAIADFADVPHIKTALGTAVGGIDGKYLRVIGNIYKNLELLRCVA